jgi:predicted membrane GTPase involved in stress response
MFSRKLSGELVRTRITKLYTFLGLDREEAQEVPAGDIVALAGVEGIQIGETITDPEQPAPLEPIVIDEPIRLIPYRPLSLEQALDFIADDEYVEVTPKSIRLRKKIIAVNRRPKPWEKKQLAPTV